MDANPNSGITAQNVVSAFNVFKPQELNKLMLPYADEGATFFQEMNALGFVKGVSQINFFHTEKGRYNQSFTVAALADPGAGVQANLTVQAAWVQNGTVFARVGDIIMNPVNRVKLRVQAKAGAVLTVKPINSTESIGVVTIGTTYTILTSAFGHGTTQPESAYPTVQKFEHKMQIIKETAGTDGSVMTDELWTPVMENGKSTPSYYNIAWLGSEYRQYQRIDGALLEGEESDNIDDENGNPIQTTKGLFPTAIDSDGFLGTQTLDIAGFRAVDLYLRKQSVGGRVCGYLGINKWAEATDNLQALFANTNIENVMRQVATDMYGGSMALAATLDYQAVTVNGRDFILKNLRGLDNPTTFNVAGAPFLDYGLFIPMTKTTDGEGKLSSYIGMRYKELAGYSRLMELWEDGAAGPGQKIGPLDQKLAYWRSDVGAHYLKTSQWAMVTG